LKSSKKLYKYFPTASTQILVLTILSCCFLVTPSSAEDWAVKEGVTILRYCRGSEVRFSTSPPKDFELCLTEANRGSFNKATPASNYKFKDFSEAGEAKEFSAEERKQMTREFRALKEKQEKEAPEQALKELNQFVNRWQTDGKFRKEILDSLSSEDRALLQQFHAGQIEIMKGFSMPAAKRTGKRVR